jgi:hypothetical protein
VPEKAGADVAGEPIALQSTRLEGCLLEEPVHSFGQKVARKRFATDLPGMLFEKPLEISLCLGLLRGVG